MTKNRLIIPAATLVGIVWTSAAAALTEPPAVLYGKVLQHGEGAAYQLFSGAMEVTVVSGSDPANRVVLKTALREVGEDGSFSFRLELPQKYLPAEHELDEYLEVDRAPSSFRIENVTVDGEPASPLDETRASLSTAFALRAGQHRMDVRVSLPESDADDDEMPDWWEDRYTLNRNSAADAEGDLDGDGLTNLEEFQGGTDPLVANTLPLLRTKLLVFPAGGTAGVALSIVDVDSAPDAIELRITGNLDEVTFFKAGAVLPPDKPFTYGDILEGRVTAEIGIGFDGGTLELEIRDTDTGVTGAAAVAVDAFSPWSGGGVRPSLWLDAAGLVDGLVSEWPDRSGNGRDAFQPDEASRPEAEGGVVDFGEAGHLFVDMDELMLGEFSAFFVFDLTRHHKDGQTLLRTSEVAVTVDGEKAGGRPRALVVTQADRTAVGPPVATGALSQISLVGDGRRTFFNFGGAGYFPSAPADNGASLPHSFATLGGSQEIVSQSVSALFDGTLREVVLYEGALTPAQRTRNEDYQRSRFGEVVVWDYRDETAPVAITGVHGAPNVISGGWGNDSLTGGAGADVLRGGPGDDVMMGNAGGDWFEVGRDVGGADTVADFSLDGGDVVNLSDIFGDQSGDPAAFVNLRSKVVLSSHRQPVVNTVIELDYDGDGSGVDQTVTLSGVPLSNTGLVDLIARGALVLGGPRYQTTVTLASQDASFPAVPVPREIEVTRSGVTDSEALSIPLTFEGTADIDLDFLVEGLSGDGSVRTVEFEPGETTKRFAIKPLAKPENGGATIVIDVLEGPDFSEAPSLTLTMTDAATLLVATASHASTEDGAPGVVRFTRSGPVDRALTLELAFDGSAENGVDFETLSNTVTIPAGAPVAELRFVPVAPGGGGAGYPVASVRVTTSPQGVVLLGSASASVVFFDGADRGAGSFADWKNDQFPGDTDPALAGKDPDGDSITNIWEYVYGTDPHEATPLGEVSTDVRLAGDGHLEVGFKSMVGFTDVQLEVVGSDDLAGWAPARDLQLVVHPPTGEGDDGRARRVYRSVSAVRGNSSASPHRGYRFRVYALPPPFVESTK